jgi:hypothetical protein
MLFSIVYAGFRLLVNLVAVQALGRVSSSDPADACPGQDQPDDDLNDR